MTLTEKIKSWLLDGSDPTTGLPLMKEAGVSEVGLKRFSSDPDRYKDFIRKWLERFIGVASYSFSETKKKSFREEFPFINEIGCPIELQTLVTRKITAYHNYVNEHKKLISCSNAEEMGECCRLIIENYLDNRSIYDELNYYKNHHYLLGKHPIFDEMNHRKRLNNLSIKELYKRKIQVENNIWRVKSEIKKGDKPELIVKRRDKLRSYQEELADIERMLG